MKLIAKLNDYLLEKMLQEIATDNITNQEKDQLVTIGLDQHAFNYIKITNGNVSAFKKMYTDVISIDDISEDLDKISQ